MANEHRSGTLIHCESCGEHYIDSYKCCPFCGEKPGSKRAANASQRMQYAFGDMEETPRSRAHRRKPREGGIGQFIPASFNRTQLIALICSLVTIAALIVIVVMVYPAIQGNDPFASDTLPPVSQGPASQPSAAPYEDITYTVTVTGGTGRGDYTEGSSVTIAAALEEGRQFKGWTGTEGLTFTSGDATTATATFTMPAQAVNVAATYEDILSSTYAVTVTGGTGGGDYAEGDSVTIVAGVPEEGKRFKEWTWTSGLTFTSGSASTATATFTMPAQAVNVTATYEDIPSTTYAVTVTGGTGRGDYAEGDSVTITAGAPSAGKRFRRWTGTNGLTFTSGSASTATATFTMPARAVNVTASYEDITYAVTVTGGSGRGSYAEGASVTITAGTPEAGKRFKGWAGADGLTFTSGNAAAATATFTMPARAVSVTATYEDIPSAVTYTVTVAGGTGRGSYASGASVTISAAAPEEGKRFKEWTGADGLAFTSGSTTTATATFTMPTRAVSVTATYEDIPPTVIYTITLHAGGGIVTPARVGTEPDGTLASLPTPTRAGYTFDGWYTTATGSARVTTNTVFSSNMTIYAQWTYRDTTQASPFADLSEDDPYYEAVMYCLEEGLLTRSSANFNAGNTATRSMVLTALARMEGLGGGQAEAMAWAAANNIDNGQSEGTVTLAQLVTILHRYAAYKGHAPSAADDAAMSWAWSVGLLNSGDSLPSSSGAATRGLAAQLLARFHKLV